jgi:CPA2 family monovalent cation:H+ antiporter-2
VLFFVSIGMLVNPSYLIDHAGKVLALTGLIIVGKALLTILIGLLLPCSGSTVLVVAAGLSQIGEFSFIVGQAGVSLGIMTQEQYSLILAGALLSIMLNPLMFRLLPGAERFLRQRTAFWRLLDRHGPAKPPPQTGIADHIVVVGCGRVGEHVVSVLEHLGIPKLVVEIDAGRVAELGQRGVATLYGDAANSEVLTHVALERARALVVTLPEQSATEMVVAAARELAPSLPIIARASTRTGGERLARLGEVEVIQPELEGGLEVMRHTLLLLGYPAVQVQQFTDTARRDSFDPTSSRTQEYLLLEKLVGAIRGIEIVWRGLEPGSLLAGKTIAEASLRATTGASVIALIRQGSLEANPKANTMLTTGDILGLLGNREQIAAAEPLFAASAHDRQTTGGY